MILSKEVKMKISPKNLKHFKSLGYTDLFIKKEILIPVEHLTHGSNTIINVKCDVCGKEKNLSYSRYTKNLKSYNYYACSQKCAVNKFETTCLTKYNSRRPIGNKDIKEKIKKTLMERYSVDCYIKTEEYKIKSKITSLKKYNVEYPLQNKEIRDKGRETSLKRYGVEYSTQLDSTQEKIKKSKIKNGVIVSDELAGEFKLYKRKVKNYTHKNKKLLFENWDGYDYYDKEYIREYKNLHYLNRNYPTIDHKISVFYGFVNNVDPKEIGGIDNLCITKKHLNSIKSIKCSLN